MNASLQRLTSLFLATILVGVLATMFAPVLAGSLANAQQPTAMNATVAMPASMTSTPVSRGTVRITVARATRALLRGDTLRAGDFALSDTTIVWHWTSIAPDSSRPAIGWMIRRPIAAGELLRAPAVTPAPVINAGAKVQLLWQDGPVRLVLSGVATNAAAVGANVGVRLDHNRRLDGIAVAANLVRLR